MTPVEITRGAAPLILGMPHTGTHVPAATWERLNETGRALADTDWHVDRLYDGLVDGATVVRATFHRYVIDANRPPDGASLYPGQNTTGLVPLTDFDGSEIWSRAPSADEIEAARMAFHAPYHAALAGEIARLCESHDHVLLYDCHSIRSVVPYLFDGTLPDLNIGTDGGATCAPALEAAAATAAKASGRSTVLNGRFRGGWTTRHYGQPARGVHAIQMEIAQSAYLAKEAPPWDYDAAKADALRGDLAAVLDALMRALKEL